MKSDEVRRKVYARCSVMLANDPEIFASLQSEGVSDTQIRKAVEHVQASFACKSEYRPHAKATPEPIA